MAADEEYVTEGLAAGFTREQIKWIDDWYAAEGHEHAISDIEGLEEALEGEDSD